MEVILPYLHMVSDEIVPHIRHLYKHKNSRQFQSDIENLCRVYKPIDLHQYISMRKNLEIPGVKSFLLTFDDGFREMYDVVAPILLHAGIPATFFVTNKFVDNKEMYFGHKKSILIEHCLLDSQTKKKAMVILDKYNCFKNTIIDSIKTLSYNNRDVVNHVAEELKCNFDSYLKIKKPYLSSDQIFALLKQGFTIGAHSQDHPRFTQINQSEQIFQTVESVRSLREQFSLNYGAFAFPHSSAGVTVETVNKIYSSDIVDITFGTGGMVNKNSWNVERFSIEKPLWPVKIIILKEKIRSLYHTCNLDL